MSILDLALEYLEKYEFSIIPMKSIIEKKGDEIKSRKIPLVEKVIPYRTKLPTREEVINWWTKWPDAMIGCIVGELSGVMGIDADQQAGIDKMNELLPDSLEVPIVKTPRNEVSRHYYFKNWKGIGNKQTECLELKGENSILILPGSVRADGNRYYLENGSKLSDLPDLPIAIYNYLLSFNIYLHGKPGKYDFTLSNNLPQIPQNTTLRFREPGRNDDIFHLANAAIKGSVNQDILQQGMEIIARNCDPPLSVKELYIILKSAADRASRKDRNIAQVVNEYVEYHRTISQEYHILYHIFAQESQIATKSDDKAARMQFKRLCDCEPPVLAKEDARGAYRIINMDDNEQKWWLSEGDPLKIKMPFDIEKLTKVFPGNIILLEGQKSQGKTTFAIEFCRLNRNLYPDKKILYHNVEMRNAEITERFDKYEEEKIINKEEWKTFLKIMDQKSNWSDKIDPDGLNVVDYLIEYDQPFILPRYIFEIHKRLKSGICLCLIQRDPFKPYGKGGVGTRDIPRLIISLLKHNVRIEDAKSFWPSKHGNPTGLSLEYKHVAYCKLEPQTDWVRKEEEKYTAFLGKT